MNRLSARTRLGLLFAAVVGLHAGNALADQAVCTSDDECAAGEVCVSLAAPCDDPSECAQGEAYCMPEREGRMPSGPLACSSDSDCEADTYCYAWDDDGGSCLPDWMIPCAMDSDCTTSFRCLPFPAWGGHSSDGWDQPMPAPGDMDIPPSEGSGSDGDGPPPPDFRAMELPTFCLPQWVGPCVADADCGEGFTCEEEVYEMCQGGGATPGSPGVPDAPDAPPEFRDGEVECSTEHTGDYYCEIVEVPCESSADCLNGWSCETFDGDSVCSSTPDGDTVCEIDDNAGAFCVPPYAMDLIDAIGGGYGNAETDASLGDPRPGVPSLPGTGEQGDDDFSAPPRAEGADGSGGGGCAVASTAGGGLLGSTLLLGVLGLLRRRDRR